jgi:hypothetical protein
MADILKEYFAALGRLKEGKPVNVPKGTRITNDSVSLEAGRKKGTIKKSRPIFSDLIEAIDMEGGASPSLAMKSGNVFPRPGPKLPAIGSSGKRRLPGRCRLSNSFGTSGMCGPRNGRH